MLVSQHAIVSALAAVVAAPMVRHKANLGLFLAAAVGQDVDHYLWYAAKFRDPSLARAYRFFRSQYGRPPREHKLKRIRFLHGLAPLAAVSLTAVGERRLVPVALGIAFHDFLDLVNEHTLMPIAYEKSRRREKSKAATEDSTVPGPLAASHPPGRSITS